VFSPELKYAWGDPTALQNKDSVMMSPIVIQLDDDNCDMIVDEKDIPEIVFSTFTGGAYTHSGTLHAISIVKGAIVEKWSKPPTTTDALQPGAHLAGGNIDGLAGNEIVTCTTSEPIDSGANIKRRTRAYTSEGDVLWTSEAGACQRPSIVDLDGDGNPEVLTESQILNGKTGEELHTFANNSEVTAADITGDGIPEIVTPVRVLNGKGEELVDARNASVTGGGLASANHVAVADLDKDGKPEIINVNSGGSGSPNFTNAHTMNIWRYDPAAPGKAVVIRRNVDINGSFSPSLCPVNSAGNTRGGGPVTVADFNGDKTADIALAGGVAYVVFDGTKVMDPAVTDVNTVLWIKQTHDCSSAGTGSSVFDFDGDGQAEVVYSDEYYLRIYRGATGEELFKTCNTTGTLSEYPLVADVDNDAHADLIVVSNSYSSIKCPEDNSKQSGVRVFGDKLGKWVRTRRIWNQHSYHVTNVDEDGTIPRVELPNWLQPRLNNFRQNVQPNGEFLAPDLVAWAVRSCNASGSLSARITNVGQAAVEAPVVVGFYNENNVRIGSATTSITLFPGESETVVFKPKTPVGSFHVIVDDEQKSHPWHECNTDNNRSNTSISACEVS